MLSVLCLATVASVLIVLCLAALIAPHPGDRVADSLREPLLVILVSMLLLVVSSVSVVMTHW